MMRLVRSGWAAAVFGGALALPFSALGETIVGAASVIDGERIRLHGIDAPESGQLCRDADDRAWRCGQQSALALDDQIGGATVQCEGASRDRYDRLIAVCSARTVDLNAWMVRMGWAVAFRRYLSGYVAHETAAAGEKRGVWRGRFAMPWNWRKGDRLSSVERNGVEGVPTQ